MTEANSTRIVTYSRVLRGVCAIGFALVPLLLGGMWFLGSEAFLLSGEAAYYLVPHGVGFEVGRLTPALRLAGFMISMIPGGLTMWALWHLAKLFGCFSRLQFFTSDSVRSFRVFATAVLLTGVARPLAGGLMSMATTFGNAPGNRYLSFTAGNSELTAVFLGFVLLVVALVMEQGQRISEENQEII
ncbi:MAG: DUF2975 domain-containing protein [Pseudomonadales bacterium]|nr:DUF2975 domain-containing protein [Pseudomonadales bacterium]